MKFTKRQESSGGGQDKFLKFKDGESKNLILRGEIFEFYMKWVNGKSQAAESNDPEAKVRFKINAVEGSAVKIWEFPLTVYNQLASINEEYPLEKTVIKVTRHGTGTDTVYHVLPLLKATIPAAIERLELHILGSKPKQEIRHDFPQSTDYGDEHSEIPF